MGLALIGATAPSPARAVTLDEVVAYLGFDAAEMAEIRAGKVVGRRISQSREKTELAISVATLFPETLKEAYTSVQRGDAFEVDRNVLAFHEIRSWPPAPADFAGAKFGPDESSEVSQLLDFTGGSDFNLSKPEIARFRGLRERFDDAADPAARAAASAAMAAVLLERYRAYRERGLAGLAPYDRGKGRQVDPGEKLRLAAASGKLFRENEPELYKAFAAFPKAGHADAEHRFYWIKQRVQDRPTFILAHRMLVLQPSYAALIERQYYVGHSYNSVQIATAAFPVEQQIVVFYTSRTSIDQLGGMTGSVARPIAGSRLIERVTQRFETLRASAR